MFPYIPVARSNRASAVRPWVVLICLSALQFLIAVDVTIVNIALPSIGHAFEIDQNTLPWIVIAYTITGGGLLMLGGRLGDAFGRRNLLIIGTVVFGLASLAAGLAESFLVLVIARIFQGVGEALALPAAMAMIVLLFPEGPSRSRALSIWAAVASCGLVLGFLLSGIIVEFLGWRWIFLIAVPIVLFVLVTTAALLPRDKPRERKPLDVFGSILLTCAPLLFSYGIVEIGKGRNIGWLPFLAFIGASVSVALFVLVEMHTRNPLIPLSFFRNRSRTRANLATALLSAALSTSFLLLTFYLQDRLRLSALQAGLMLVPLAACLVIAVLVVPRLLGRWGARNCSLTGISFAALGLILIALADQVDAPVSALVPAMLLMALGMGFGLIGLQYVAVTGVTDDNAGVASGVQRAADQLGGSAGVALYIGVGFSPSMVGADPYLLSSGLAVIGLIAAATIASGIAPVRSDKPSTTAHCEP